MVVALMSLQRHESHNHVVIPPLRKIIKGAGWDWPGLAGTGRGRPGPAGEITSTAGNLVRLEQHQRPVVLLMSGAHGPGAPERRQRTGGGAAEWGSGTYWSWV